jgi:hypothetical protein
VQDQVTAISFTYKPVPPPPPIWETTSRPGWIAPVAPQAPLWQLGLVAAAQIKLDLDASSNAQITRQPPRVIFRDGGNGLAGSGYDWFGEFGGGWLFRADGDPDAGEPLTVSGAITLGSTRATTPVAGTIQWDGTHFMGFNGTAWVQLD